MTSIKVSANPLLLPYPEDSHEIDLEKTDRELFSDEFSYRYNLFWDSKFESSDVGYRTSVGSLDLNRFFTHEEIKLRARNQGSTAGIGYYSYKRESLIEELQYQELRLTHSLYGPIYGSFFGYSGLAKKFGDLGFALGFDTAPLQLEVFYVSVDHYYNDKEDEAEDEYKRLPWTAGGYSRAYLPNQYEIKVLAYYNRPYRWLRPSQGYTYENARTVLGAETRFFTNSSHDPVLKINHERKEERRDQLWDSPKFDYLQRELRRTVWRGELQFLPSSLTENYHSAGLYGLYRNAGYHNISDEGGTTYRGVWREIMGWWEFYHRLEMHHWMQYGLQAGGVGTKTFTGAVPNWYGESKALITYEFRYSDKGSIRITGTADIDQLISRFPYRDGFPGWDGGNVQIQFSF